MKNNVFIKIKLISAVMALLFFILALNRLQILAN